MHASVLLLIQFPRHISPLLSDATHNGPYAPSHALPRACRWRQVLDHSVRAPLCACVGVVGFFSMVVLEVARALPRKAMRVGLAAASGSGIVLTCIMSESRFVNSHRAAAALAFGAAVLLVWVVALTSRHGIRAAIGLTVIVASTGAAQGAHIVALQSGLEVLPSYMLASLEVAGLIGFAVCMWACAGAGACAAQRSRSCSQS